MDSGLLASNGVAVPVDLGQPEEVVFLILFGTGFRNAGTCTATIGGRAVNVAGIAAQGQFVGLDPKALVVARYFAKEQAAIDQLSAELDGVTAHLTEMEEEHSGEDGAFAELKKVNKANVAARLKKIKGDKDAIDEAAVLNDWLKLNGEEADLKKRLKEAEAALDVQAYVRYPMLTESEIKTLVVDDKWLAALDVAIRGEMRMDRVNQQLTQRVKDLAERYETPLPKVASRAAELEAKVNRHLETMGFAWK